MTGSANVLGGTIISTFFGGLRSLVIAGGLGPSLYGIWNLLMTIFSYASFDHLGLMNGMNKKMPYLRGKEDFAQAERIKDNTFWAILIIIAAVNILLILVVLMFESYFPKGIVVAVCVLAIINILHRIYCFLNSLLRTDKAFRVLSLGIILLSSSSLIFVFLFFRVFPQKLYAALSAMLLGYLLADIFIFFRMKYRIRPGLNLNVVTSLFRTGLPIIVIQIGYLLFVSVDRWMVVGMIGQVELGYYGIGIAMGKVLYAGASTVAFTLYPFMLERFGQSDDPQQSEQLVYTPIVVLSYLMAVACTLIALVAPLLITYVLPAYIPGIDAAIILVFGIYFISVITISGNFMVSIDKHSSVLYLQMAVIPLSVVLNYIFIKIGLGIVGVALGTAITYFFYSIGITLMAFRNFSRSYRDVLLKIGRTYFPFAACLLTYLLLKYAFSDVYMSFKDELFTTSVQVLILCGISFLLILHLNSITGVIYILRDVVRAKCLRDS